MKLLVEVECLFTSTGLHKASNLASHYLNATDLSCPRMLRISGGVNGAVSGSVHRVSAPFWLTATFWSATSLSQLDDFWCKQTMSLPSLMNQQSPLDLGCGSRNTGAYSKLFKHSDSTLYSSSWSVLKWYWSFRKRIIFKAGEHWTNQDGGRRVTDCFWEVKGFYTNKSRRLSGRFWSWWDLPWYNSLDMDQCQNRVK